jgi:hypothetical protein
MASNPPAYVHSFQLQATIDLFRESVGSGCPFCTLILLEFDTKFPGQMGSTDKVYLVLERYALDLSIGFRAGMSYCSSAVYVRLLTKLDPRK